jgi:hypothetical protein
MVPPETPSFNNGIYIVFDINHLVNIKLFSFKGGVSGEPMVPPDLITRSFSKILFVRLLMYPGILRQIL